jgi:hypothetical protein
VSASARILILSFSPIARDPRVRRQIDLLKGAHQVTVAGYGPFADPQVEFVPLVHVPRAGLHRWHAVVLLLLRRFVAFHWSAAAVKQARAALEGRPFDLIIANDVDALPLALHLAGPRTRLLLDAHEYAPGEFADRLHWRLLYQAYKTWLCRTCLPRVHGFTTVCDGIADEYARVFQVPRPLVVPNVPPRQPGEPRPTPRDAIRLVHHGLASRSRQIETMIDLMRHLDRRFTLDLMLVSPEPGYLDSLRARAAGDARIRFRHPVPPSEIIAATRDFDVGLFLLPPTNLNYRFALPNKFFEFLQARLAIAIGPSPEMARLVRAHDVGVVADDFAPASLARQLERLDAAAIDRLKQASHRAADRLCWEEAQGPFRALVDRLLAEVCVRPDAPAH